MLRQFRIRNSITTLLASYLLALALLVAGQPATLHLLLDRPLPALLAQDFSDRDSTDYPPQLSGADAEIYKRVGDVQLRMYIFRPAKHEDNESRPAIVFFFGNDWQGGSPSQFKQQCRYLARRGMMALTADYRDLTRHGTSVADSVMDGKSAIRWVRSNAHRLGIDPDRIIAAGAAEGGHIAASTFVLPDFEASGEDLTVSSSPNGLVLFGPAVVLAPDDVMREAVPKSLASIRDRLGAPAERLCPYHQLNTPLPPTLILHGKSDTAFPFAGAVAFADRANGLNLKNGMQRKDDPVVLEGYEGQEHGFFRYRQEANTHYFRTLSSLDRFLVDRGLIEGPTPKSPADR